MRILVLLALCVSVWQATHAYPQDYNCKASSWKVGETFGHMLVDKFSQNKAECFIQGVPSSFKPGKKYSIQVVSKDALGHKLVVEEGMLASDKVRIS
jgi:hypothetical protein